MLLAYAARHPTCAMGPQPFGAVPATIDTGVAILCRGEIERYKQVPKT